MKPNDVSSPCRSVFSYRLPLSFWFLFALSSSLLLPSSTTVFIFLLRDVPTWHSLSNVDSNQSIPRAKRSETKCRPTLTTTHILKNSKTTKTHTKKGHKNAELQGARGPAPRSLSFSFSFPSLAYASAAAFSSAAFSSATTAAAAASLVALGRSPVVSLMATRRRCASTFSTVDHTPGPKNLS